VGERTRGGWAPERVEKFLKDDPETLALWREAVTREAYRPTESNDPGNISGNKVSAIARQGVLAARGLADGNGPQQRAQLILHLKYQAQRVDRLAATT